MTNWDEQTDGPLAMERGSHILDHMSVFTPEQEAWDKIAEANPCP